MAADFTSFPAKKAGNDEIAKDMPRGFRCLVAVEGTFACGYFSPAGVCAIRYFEQKDALQVALIRQLVRDLNIDVGLRILPTAREDSGLAMSSPAGISSLKLTPVRSVAGLGLVSVNVSVTLPFSPTVGELKDFVSVGGDCACASPVNVIVMRPSRVIVIAKEW